LPAATPTGVPAATGGAPDGVLSPKALLAVAAELKGRRELVERRERELETREAALDLVEERLAAQIDRLEGLKRDLESVLGQISADEQARLDQLAKVYEAMKAKKAASILDAMALDLLLPVVRRMRDTKVAAVIAEMDPPRRACSRPSSPWRRRCQPCPLPLPLSRQRLHARHAVAKAASCAAAHRPWRARGARERSPPRGVQPSSPLTSRCRARRCQSCNRGDLRSPAGKGFRAAGAHARRPQKVDLSITTTRTRLCASRSAGVFYQREGHAGSLPQAGASA
jgi:hypothetical protein